MAGGGKGDVEGGLVDGCASFLKLLCCLPAPVALPCVCAHACVRTLPGSPSKTLQLFSHHPRTSLQLHLAAHLPTSSTTSEAVPRRGIMRRSAPYISHLNALAPIWSRGWLFNSSFLEMNQSDEQIVRLICERLAHTPLKVHLRARTYSGRCCSYIKPLLPQGHHLQQQALCFAQKKAITGTAGQDGGFVAIWWPDWRQFNALIDDIGPTTRDKRETFFKLFPICVCVRIGNTSISFFYSL